MDQKLDSRVVRIDEIAAGGGITVTTLREQRKVLWDELFAGASARSSVQCSVCYEYCVGGLEAISMPVLMLPWTTFSLPSAVTVPDELTQSDLLDQLAATVQTWFSNENPAASGMLVFDLVVMPGSGMPLLELPNLTLPISSICPPLQTS